VITVKHSGNVGDIIYSLPVVKQLGIDRNDKVHFYLNPIDDRMSQSLANSIIPLLTHQDYICGATIYDKEHVDYDLDKFRNYQHSNLGQMHCNIFGYDYSILDSPSIVVKPELVYDLKTYNIIVNRTQRYNNDSFPWENVLNEKYGNETKGFVGFPREYEIFKDKFNISNIEYIHTDDFLQIAWLISKSDIFIGNCSSPYAIAEGLKHNTIQESVDWCLSCLYTRPNAYYFTNYFFMLP
jgi:hypothetical protein